MLADHNQDLLLKARTFDLFKNWVEYRKSYKFSLNLCNLLVDQNEERAFVYKFFLRWKRYFIVNHDDLHLHKNTRVQDKFIALSKQIAVQRSYNQVADNTLNDVATHNEKLNHRFTVARRYIVKHLVHRLAEKIRPFFNNWKQITNRLKLHDQQEKLLDLEREQMIIPHRTELIKEQNEKLWESKVRCCQKLDKLKELEQQVATLIREIKIANIKLSDKNYDYEILVLENQRYKEELYIRSQSRSSFSSHFDSDSYDLN